MGSVVHSRYWQIDTLFFSGTGEEKKNAWHQIRYPIFANAQLKAFIHTFRVLEINLWTLSIPINK